MNFQQTLSYLAPLAVAALGGLAVGIEREWSAKASGSEKRFAGVRTFLLIGLLGGLSTLIIRAGFIAIGSIVIASAAAIIVAAYVGGTLKGDRESTTEFAAILVLGAGALAGIGQLAIASGINAFTALVLVEKGRIHGLVYKIRSEELESGVRFAVMALVILPLLPEGPFGPPPGIKPRELWTLVLLFSAVSFLGFIARRAAGAERGYPVAGFLGGIISSTLVTLNFSKESQNQKDIAFALGLGVIGAILVLPVRVALLTTVINHDIGIKTIPYLAIPFVIVLAYFFFLFRRPRQENGQPELPKNPLNVFSAIKMVLAFQTALYIMKWVSTNFGSAGILATSAVVGFTDVDTLVFMLTKQQNIQPDLGAQAITVGVLSNTVLKLIIAFLVGRGSFRWIAGLGLALFAVGTGAVILFFAL
jgi:uncharacterized membrane protein (DUF4010 family)